MADLAGMTSMRDINDYCVQRGLHTLAQGMIEIPPPQLLREEAGRVLMEADTHCYRARFGEADYLAAVEQLLRAEGANAEGGGDVSGCVLATQGVTAGIVASLLHLKAKLGRAPRVALIEPFYTYHFVQIKAITGVPAVSLAGMMDVHTGRFDVAKIARALDEEAADALVVCNPHNPLGIVWQAEDLDAVRDAVVAKGRTLICDECYNEMVFAGAAHHSPLHKRIEDNVIVCRGFSKTLGAQSWRVGYAVSSKATLASLAANMDPYFVCVPLLQHAVGRYLAGNGADYRAHVTTLNGLIRDNWALLKKAFLTRFPTWKADDPSGTMYGIFFHDCAADLDAVKAALDAGVGTCPGSMFTPQGITPTAHTGMVRIHCGISKEKAEAIAKLLAP